jgi:two-component system response regulator GlrR
MTDAPRILVVDDDADLLRLIALRLQAAGFEPITAPDAETALQLASVQEPHVVVTDLRMGRLDGAGLLDAIHARNPLTPVIVLTAHGTIPDAVDLTQRGAFAFLTKPFDGRTLVEHIERALRVGAAGSTPGDSWCPQIITRSPAMTSVLERARRVAASEVTLLIQGPSGTGKELLARAVHAASRRAGGPFVAINCAAIPEHLLESELFGHVKGAFTGADRAHTGLFQAAAGGTLLLDEVGDMSAPLQAKLLRALQERQVRPVGSTKTVPIDVRVISATHRDLRAEVDARRFREDLYYRLNTVTLVLPALRDRREDIPLIARARLEELDRGGDVTHSLAPAAMDALIEAPWPGNVRQLQNVIDHAHALSTTRVIPAAIVREALNLEPSDGFEPLERARARFDRDYLVSLLKATSGNVTHAARLAGRNRTEFYKLLNRHELDPTTFKEG